MKSMCWLRLCLAGLLTGLGGCSGEARTADSGDPVKYAQSIKERVDEFLAEARANPDNVPAEAAVLLETLEVHPTQPVGDHGDVYAQLTQRCQELTTAKGAEVGRKLDEMKTLVKKLPE